MNSISFRTRYTADQHTFETTGLMFNVADRYVKGRGTLNFTDDLMDIIDGRELDREFWQHLEIVKRTPVEDEVVELFERDNLFGVF